ncbi:MAG: TlpA family protein disulfide reductase [Muribaculaceae bacterium]|nr:TlpA family protein disulfide reductase [Muribaculaceae bacterium]
MKKLLFTALLFVVSIVASVGASAQLPSVTVKDTKGKPVNVASLNNDGKPFIISFFATWCKPCIRELRAIADLYPDWADETGVKMYVVSIDDAQNTSKVKPFVDAEGWEYEVLLDANSDFFRAMGLSAVPHVLVVDGDGNIAYNHSGYTDGSETELINIVRKLNSKK